MRLEYLQYIVGALLAQGFNTGLAQISNQILFNDAESFQKISKGGSGYYALNPTYEGIDGSPYLFDWAIAQIISNGQLLSKEYEVSYVAASDVFLMRDKGLVWVMDDQWVDTLTIKNDQFITIDGKYYQLLNRDSISLLKKYKAEIQRATYIPALNTGAKSQTWKISSYYFVYQHAELKKISLTKKSIQQTLGLTKEFVQQMEGKALKFNQERDVIEILNHLN